MVTDLLRVVLIAFYNLKLSLLVNCQLNKDHSIVTGINTNCNNGGVDTQLPQIQYFNACSYQELLGTVDCCSRFFLYNSRVFDMV